MDLAEPIGIINRQLRDHYGIDTDTTQAIWRVVWSEDQFEMRRTDRTDGGIIMLVPEVRQLPKYRQWLPNMYVLEQLVIVPEINLIDLPGEKKSYEPMFPFKDKDGNPLPPRFRVAKFVIDAINAAKGKKSMRKYVDEEAKNPLEHREMRINKLQEELFGDASGLENKTTTGEAVAGFYPQGKPTLA